MGINIFGETIIIPSAHDVSQIERLLEEVAKRKEERIILQKFISEQIEFGKSRFDEMASNASREVREEPNLADHRSKATDFFMQILKNRITKSGITVYENLVLGLIEQIGDSRCQEYCRKARLRQGVNGLPPATLPGNHKRAEVLLNGKLRSDIGEKETQFYLTNKILLRELSLCSKDLFFAVNLGLDTQQTLAFMKIAYDLRQLRTALPTNEVAIRKTIVKAIRNGTPLEMIHIKCLRFAYPNGKRLQIIDDLEDHAILTKEGKIHQPISEKEFPARLKNIKRIFEERGVQIKLTILLSDQDLDDYFPDGNRAGVVPSEDLARAKESLLKYEDNLKQVFTDDNVLFLKQHLDSEGILDQFNKIRSDQLKELQSGGGILGERFVESRINYRFESNARILTDDPGRAFARERVYAQLASLQALSVLRGQENDRLRILIEEDRGDENKYIGGYKSSALPVIFIKLRGE